MKKLLFNTAFLTIAVCTMTTVLAQNEKKDKQHEEPKYAKTKNYTKSYALNGSDKVSLGNQFGEMKFTTWDKNEVKVDVAITTKSNDEQRAEEMLSQLSVEDNKDGNTVSFKTKLSNKKKENKQDDKNYQNESMQINYSVFLPSGTALKAENQFGSMILPDYRGEVEIKSQFGSLTTGKLSNVKIVTVQYGEVSIGEIDGGELNIDFSSGTVEKLGGDVKSKLNFSEVKLNIGNDIKNLNVKNSYSTIYLDLDKSLSAAYEITTSFGKFSNKSSFDIKEKDAGQNNRGSGNVRRYNGTSGSGGSKVTVVSSFGSIIAGHDLKPDLKKKNKTREV
jgi:hypothetical protein